MVRIYSKKFLPKLPVASGWIWGIMYTVSMPRRSDLPTMEELAVCSRGIQRIAVCRMEWTTWARRFTLVSSREGETDPVKRQRFANLPPARQPSPGR